MNLKNVSAVLPDYFFRINKSYTINTRQIASFDNNDVVIGTYEIGIGESFRNVFFEKFIAGKRVL